MFGRATPERLLSSVWLSPAAWRAPRRSSKKATNVSYSIHQRPDLHPITMSWLAPARVGATSEHAGSPKRRCSRDARSLLPRRTETQDRTKTSRVGCGLCGGCGGPHVLRRWGSQHHQPERGRLHVATMAVIEPTPEPCRHRVHRRSRGHRRSAGRSTSSAADSRSTPRSGVVLAVLASWLGFGYRVMTAGVIGANIGGGVVLLMTPILGLVTVASVAGLGIRASRRAKRATQPPPPGKA